MADDEAPPFRQPSLTAAWRNVRRLCAREFPSHALRLTSRQAQVFRLQAKKGMMKRFLPLLSLSAPAAGASRADEKDRLIIPLQGLKVRNCVAARDQLRGKGLRSLSWELLIHPDPGRRKPLARSTNPRQMSASTRFAPPMIPPTKIFSARKGRLALPVAPTCSRGRLTPEVEQPSFLSQSGGRRFSGRSRPALSCGRNVQFHGRPEIAHGEVGAGCAEVSPGAVHSSRCR